MSAHSVIKLKKISYCKIQAYIETKKYTSLKMLLYKIMTFIVYICMCLNNTLPNQQIQTKFIKCLHTKKKTLTYQTLLAVVIAMWRVGTYSLYTYIWKRESSGYRCNLLIAYLFSLHKTLRSILTTTNILESKYKKNFKT